MYRREKKINTKEVRNKNVSPLAFSNFFLFLSFPPFSSRFIPPPHLLFLRVKSHGIYTEFFPINQPTLPCSLFLPIPLLPFFPSTIIFLPQRTVPLTSFVILFFPLFTLPIRSINKYLPRILMYDLP